MPALVFALALALIASLPRSLRAQDAAPVPLARDLGAHHYAVTTRVPAAQAYFDQGLRLYYAFNHAEAIRAFREAQRLDASCAMCWWGEALAWGPNINAAMDSASGAAAYAALRRARDGAGGVSERERALIASLEKRYAPVPPAQRAALDSAYAGAMQAVARSYPDDAEAATLYAESLMDLSPWSYWARDGAPRPDTPMLLETLESVLARHPNHPGANHFYIHAVEAVQPEKAVAAAERLAALMPGAGHLVHMPGHIYIRVGRYLDAIQANEHAVHADETFIRDRSPEFGAYTAGYYPHNYDFLAFAASMIGRETQAIEAAEKVRDIARDDLLGVEGMSFLQHHETRHLQMRIRFGRWDEILASPAPPAGLPHAAAMWHYARGRALAARGDLRGAEAQLAMVRAAAADRAAATRRLEFNSSAAVLGIAAEVLAGHIAAARRDYDLAIRTLRTAVRLQDELTYGEPPEWTVPVRQELGAVLLDAGKAAAAEEAFRQDLRNFPENGWSLRGLASALRKQGRSADAAAVEARFGRVWQGPAVSPAPSRGPRR